MAATSARSGAPSSTPLAPPLGRAFLTVWFGQTTSLIGTTATAVGAALWAYQQTGQILWLSLLMLANQIPVLLLSPMAGARVDRSSRRRILLTADAFAAAATLAAVAVHATVGLQPWHLVILIVIGSCANAFQEPAYQASLPMLVPREALGRANGLLQLAPAVSMVAGAPFAGVALAAGGIAAVLAVDLVTFVVAVVATAITAIPDPLPSSTTAEDGASATSGSIRAVWRHLSGDRRGLRRLALGFAGVNLLLGTTNVLFLALALSVSSEAVAGLVAGLAGAGMVASSFYVSAKGVAANRVRSILLGIAGVGAGLVVAGSRPLVLVVTVGMVIMLASVPPGSAASNTLFMEKIAADWQGRLQAFRRVVSQTLMPLSTLLIVPVVDRWAETGMAPGGALANTIGAVIGTGPGRGIALVFVLAGLGVIVMVAAMAADPVVRLIQTEVPDAVAPGTSSADEVVLPHQVSSVDPAASVAPS